MVSEIRHRNLQTCNLESPLVASDAVMPELNANVVQHVSEVPKHQSSCAHGSELNVQRSAHLRRASNSRGPRLMEFERACSSWSGRDCELSNSDVS